MAAARRIRRDHVQGNKRSRGLISAFICGAAVYGAAKLIAVHVCMYVCMYLLQVQQRATEWKGEVG